MFELNNIYESIPSGGVPCWVSDEEDSIRTAVDMINEYVKEDDYSYVSEESYWKYATPIKPEDLANETVH